MEKLGAQGKYADAKHAALVQAGGKAGATVLEEDTLTARTDGGSEPTPAPNEVSQYRI